MRGWRKRTVKTKNTVGEMWLERVLGREEIFQGANLEKVKTKTSTLDIGAVLFVR